MENNLTIALFAKKVQSKDGGIFYKYLTTLTRKDGSTFSCQVKFKGDDKNKPDTTKCPMNIIVSRESANLVKRALVDKETAEVYDAFTLWVSEWTEGDAYVDHSLDDIV